MVYRQLLDNPMVKKPAYCHLWVVLLLSAAHKKSEFIWNNRKMTLLPGQILTGRKRLSERTGIPESTVYKILKYFKTEHQIEQQTYPKFSVITVKNWEKFQRPAKKEQQRNSSVTAEEQQRNTYNKVKNANKDKKYSQNSDEFRLSQLLLDLILERKTDFKRPDLQRWSVHVNRMIRLDGRDSGRVEAVIRWCQQEDFWQNNILSTEKLRKHFDRLELEMTRNEKEPQQETIEERLERLKDEGRLND